MSKSSKFTTISASKRLMESMEQAINNMIDEIKKPVDPEAGGSARKAELQSIKQTAIDCKELLVERQRLEVVVSEKRKTTQAVSRKGSPSKWMTNASKRPRKKKRVSEGVPQEALPEVQRHL